jgi:hypothetical protein
MQNLDIPGTDFQYHDLSSEGAPDIDKTVTVTQ